MEKITVQNTSVMIISINKNDYISLTDIAKYKSDDPTAVIGNWMRNRNTIEYLGIWESLYNPNFKPLEFEGFKKEAGLNTFTLSPTKWISTTNAIGNEGQAKDLRMFPHGAGGADHFMNIHSVVETAKKNGNSKYNAILAILG